jgi:hypothetical protein
MKRKNDEAFPHWVGRDIGREAKRQIVRGTREEFRKQLTRSWGDEFAHQIFGIPPHRRGRSR